MNSHTEAPAPPMPPSLPMIRTLAAIALIAGVLVAFAYQATLPTITEQERMALEEAIFRVMPGVDATKATRVSFKLTPDGLTRIDDKTPGSAANLYAVYDASGALQGIAMEGSAQGYSDLIKTLFDYRPDCECIVGLAVTKSSDTPGFGAKDSIEGHKDFMANFERLDVKLNADKSAVAHPVEVVKHGTKTQPWQIDAMSGATISSRAIGNGIRLTTEKMLPLLAKRLDEIKVKR